MTDEYFAEFREVSPSWVIYQGSRAMGVEIGSGVTAEYAHRIATALNQQGVAERLAALARDEFYLIESAARHMALPYDAGFNAEMRAFHARLPKELHRDDCDGCAYLSTKGEGSD